MLFKTFLAAGCSHGSPSDPSAPHASRRVDNCGSIVANASTCFLFACPSGYDLYGTAVAYCYKNWHWSPPIGTCRENPLCK